MNLARRRSALMLCAFGMVACGSSTESPAVVEFSTVPDGSTEGQGDSIGSDDRDSSSDVSAVQDVSRDTSAAPESTMVDVSSPLDPLDGYTFQPSDGPHIQPPPSDAPADTGPVDAGCAPGCDVGCLTVHDNGVGGTYTDCTPLGTYNVTQANLAANSAANVPGGLMGSLSCGFGANTSTAVCKIGPDNCACWAYAATGTFLPNIGHATNNTVLANCLCPSAIDPTWN